MPFLRERNRAWSPQKIIALIGVLAPGCWLIARFVMDDLGARPVTEAIHFVGDWTVRILWITLAITPAARLFKAPKLLLARRTLGVASFAYIFTHLALYVVDQKFKLDTVAIEIALRFYLTIGFVALVGLAALAATSTDGMIRRMRKRWDQLHMLVYPIATLAVIHYLLQSKNDVWNPMLMVGFLLWLFGYRILLRHQREVSYPRLVALAALSGVLTMVIEIGWYHFRSNVPVERILQANFDFSYVIHPAWWVLAVTLAIPLAAWLWSLWPHKANVRKSAPRASPGAVQAKSAS
jgi:sulfoxide reductase heme-binding subunit YedZ